MRKRLIEKLKGKNGSTGFTLTEMLVVIAIIALVCTIVIASVAAISTNLKFKQKDEYAKTIFMAAQQNLSELRSDGSLATLQGQGTPVLKETIDAGGITTTGFSDFPVESWAEEYEYVSSEDMLYSVVLPVNSVESVLRDQQVIIEYNPYTGSVYAVFYSEEDDSLLNLYTSAKGISRDDESERKKLMVGYYCGTGAGSPELNEQQTKAQVEFTNGEEGIVTVKIPIPDAYFTDVNPYDQFVKNLEVKLTITGKTNGERFEITAKAFDDEAENCSLDTDGKTVLVTYVLDSLATGKSFANLSANTAESLTTIQNESAFAILPGENVTIQAEVTCKDATLEIENGVLTGVNPMFEYLGTDGAGGYVLAVSNGRNLQNLNALAPSIAEKVVNVVFMENSAEEETVSALTESGAADGTGTEDAYNVISWADTVAYYNNKYGAAGTNTDEAPARALPYFVPIQNAVLLGASADENGVETWTVGSATVTGNDTRIVGLNIDVTGYGIPTNAKYYANQSVSYQNTGLFASANTTIDGLYIVNPIIKGYSDTTAATGALVGLSGPDNLITNCGVYIDKDPETGFDVQYMTDPVAYSKTEPQTWYGVSGQGAVGGLVGSTKSSRTDNAFSKSFAAVPVSGDTNVGGFVGEAATVKFDSCYASGDALASASGAGGFVGSSSGSQYSNCFATGDAEGTGSVGGFVGAMSGDSFDSCYCVGVTTTKGTTGSTVKEKFSGTNSTTKIESCYFLNLNRNSDKNSTNDNDCAHVAEYGKLTNLHTATNGTKGFQNGAWDAASADKTHSYQMNGGVYPFSMLKDMDYYGDWPTGPLDVGITYYEYYKGIEDPEFYFDSKDSSTLKSQPVKSDGYAILTKNSSTSVKVEIESENTTYSDTLTAEKESYTPRGNTDDYAVYLLPKAALTAAAEQVDSDNFYAEVKVTYTPAATGNETPDPVEYTFYFNPNAAYTHVNPSYGTTASNPGSAPKQIAIRSARQLAALDSNSKYNYVQELDINANDYTASSYTTAEATAIKNAIMNASPTVAGTYNGSGKIITLHENKTTGLFGTISGTVKDLNVVANGVSVDGTSSGSAGIVVNTIASDGAVEKVNLTLSDAVSVTANSAGLFAGSINGTATNCKVTAGGMVTFSTGGIDTSKPVNQGGFAGSIGGTVSDVSVSLNTVGGNTVGGFAGTITSNGSVSDTSVKLGSNISGETAAGHTVSIAGGSVQNSTVELNGQTISGKTTAAGFACTVSGKVSDCAVVGTGEIEAQAGSAAGFAGTVSGQVTGSRVTPATAETADKYLNNSNANLTVKGTDKVAGFALSVGKNGKITNCNALGTISGGTYISGFVDTNQGTISGCIANVSLPSGGNAFAAANSGTVTNSYGWYEAKEIKLPSGIKYKSCYFADISGSQNTVLFDSDGNSEEILNTDLTSSNTVSRLNGNGGKVWTKAGSDAYPYSLSDGQSSDYPYPMLRVHPGNWANATDSSPYGIVYYEKYSDSEAGENNYSYHTVVLGNPSTETGTPVTNTGGYTLSDTRTIVETGYALFCKEGSNPFGSNIMGNKLTGTLASKFSNLYNGYALYTLKAKGELEINDVPIVTFYADAIDVDGDAEEPYQIRTAEQLANIDEVSGAVFQQTHNITVDESFKPATTLNGTYDGNGYTISGTVAPTGNFGFLAVKAGASAVIDDVNVSGTIGVTAKDGESYIIGGLVGTSSGDISNSEVDVIINYTQAESDSATIGGLVGKASGGTIGGTTTNNVNVSGQINLLHPKMNAEEDEKVNPSGAGRSYTVGGAVGSDGGAEYTNVTSSVSVDAAWATKSADPTADCPGGKGAIGMFVGKVTSGEFNTCASTAENSTYQFLGEIEVKTTNLEGDNWYTKDSSDPVSVPKDQTVESAGYTAVNSNKKYDYSATLNSCTFEYGEDTYVQRIQTKYYFQMTEGETENTFTYQGKGEICRADDEDLLNPSTASIEETTPATTGENAGGGAETTAATEG